MKELSIEEKAKAYDEALAKLKRYEGNPTLWSYDDMCEKFFPELAESEDEKIRKWLVEELYKSVNSSIITRDFDIYMGRKALAWLEKQKLVDKDDLDFAKRLNELRKVQREKNLDELIEMRWSALKDVEKLTKEMFTRQAKFFFEVGYEKQGEQKPTGVEPKFKVGDWITNGIDCTFQIHSIENNMYLRSDDYFIDIETADKKFRLWSIQDAKDGDVLATENFIFIFKDIDDCNGVHYYCDYDIYEHEDDAQFGIAAHGSIMGIINRARARYSPATKEQRNLLFSKMKEAGYEWDAINLKLNRISQSMVSAEAKETMYDKPAWGEEDEKQVRQIERIIHDDGCTQKLQKQIADWFNSLKDRVQPQPKQDWSEEDWELLNEVRKHIVGIMGDKPDFTPNKVYEGFLELIDRLKLLRPYKQWKPSDLPHWKKSTLPNDNTTGFNSDYFCHKGYYINYKELFEKLPKDD